MPRGTLILVFNLIYFNFFWRKIFNFILLKKLYLTFWFPSTNSAGNHQGGFPTFPLRLTLPLHTPASPLYSPPALISLSSIHLRHLYSSQHRSLQIFHKKTTSLSRLCCRCRPILSSLLPSPPPSLCHPAYLSIVDAGEDDVA